MESDSFAGVSHSLQGGRIFLQEGHMILLILVCFTYFYKGLVTVQKFAQYSIFSKMLDEFGFR